VSDSVLVFSADDLRGKIIKKVLARGGFDCLLFTRMVEDARSIDRQGPKAVIFDTEGCFPQEIDHLGNICRTLKRTVAIVLGQAVVIERFKGFLIGKALCLADPLDPELIAAKIKEITAPRKRRTGSDALEKTLKRFLNLT